MKNRILALSLIVVFGLAFAPSSYAKHKKKSQDSDANTPGNFDYYLLTLSWAPHFCATNSRSGNSAECDPKKHVGLVVHGLWPQYNDGGWPQDCATAPPVASATVDHVMAIMPSRGLIQHEWSKHGTCSGLSADAYFKAIDELFAKLKIPEPFKRPGENAGTKPGDIESAFASANNAPRDAFRVSCPENDFSAVEICLTKDFQYKACPSSVRQCRAPQLQVRSIP